MDGVVPLFKLYNKLFSLVLLDNEIIMVHR